MTKMVSAREFNQQTSRISKVAATEPVVITDRGRPSRVLMSYEEYQRLKGPGRTLHDLAMSLPEVPDSPEIDAVFEEVMSRKQLHVPFEFED